MKICSKCNIEKPLEDFAKRKSAKDGTRAECKHCFNQYYKRYYSIDNRMDKHALLVANNKKKYKWNVGQLKLTLGCKICGYNKCVRSLHFHHLDRSTKVTEISILVQDASKEQLEEELKKCVVLCANCHGEVEEGIIEISKQCGV